MSKRKAIRRLVKALTKSTAFMKEMVSQFEAHSPDRDVARAERKILKQCGVAIALGRPGVRVN